MVQGVSSPRKRGAGVARKPLDSRVRGNGCKPKPRVGLALAGGGPLGAIYELGALLALSESLEGVDFSDLDVYVGVSAGGFIAAGLANGLTPERMRHMFIESDTSEEPFEPEQLLKPAFREYALRALSVPPLLLASIWNYLANPWSQSFFESFQRLSRAIPTGIFNITGIDRFLSRTYSAAGRSNDFRRLKRKLYLVATDLDSGESVVFGSPGRDHVPISTAVQASAALPGLFPPVEIGGRHYVDGALKKTLHASVALKEGAELVLCVNPLVPYQAIQAGARRVSRSGISTVMAQTIRTAIRSRMSVGLAKYRVTHPGSDVVLFEPRRDDADTFFTNIFSLSSRRRLCEHAYLATRADLLERHATLEPVLRRHGLSINLGVLRHPAPRLVRELRADARAPVTRAAATLDRLGRTLDDLDRAVGIVAARKAAEPT